jgi:hypothetical protein
MMRGMASWKHSASDPIVASSWPPAKVMRKVPSAPHPRCPMTRRGDAVPLRRSRVQRRVRPGGDDDASLRLAEEQARGGVFAQARQVDVDAERLIAIHHRALGQRHGEAAVAAVVRGAHMTTVDALEEGIDEALLPVEIDLRWCPDREVVDAREVLTRPQLVGAARPAGRWRRLRRRRSRASPTPACSMRPTIPMVGVGKTAEIGLSL